MTAPRTLGRTVLVTGCSSGIGQAVVTRLRAAGDHVIGLDLVTPEDGPHIPLDLSDRESVAAAVDQLPDRIDALVNAAGVSSGIGNAQRVVAINILGLRALTEAVVPRMAPEAYIVNTASLSAARYRDHRDEVLAFLGIDDWDAALRWCDENRHEVGAGYEFSKEAVILYTASRAVELARRGIRMNATAPGVTETPILADTVLRLGREALDAIPKPLGRLATADEQARVLSFLAGDGASYICGQTIWVDGGHTAGVESGQIDPFVSHR